MNCSMAGLPVHHQLPEFTQTHVHRVGDAIQPSHSLSSPSPQSFPASQSFRTSQLFASGGQSIRVWASTSVLPMNTQDWSPLGWTGWISLQSKGLSRVFSNTTVQKRQFFGSQLSSQSNSHIHTWPLEKHNVLGKLNFKNKQTCRKRDHICGYQKWDWGWGKLVEGNQKMQPFSYKINDY